MRSIPRLQLKERHLTVLFAAIAIVSTALLVVTMMRTPYRSAPVNLPETADFTKLREEFATRKGFNPAWNIDPRREEIEEAFGRQSWKRVERLTSAWLEEYPVDAGAHMMRAEALRRLGDIPGYARHRHWNAGLIASIASSGDGLTRETAFRVISPNEEYALLFSMLGKRKFQALEYPYDRLDVEIAGRDMTLYFDISASMKGIEALLNVPPGAGLTDADIKPGERLASMKFDE